MTIWLLKIRFDTSTQVLFTRISNFFSCTFETQNDQISLLTLHSVPLSNHLGYNYLLFCTDTHRGGEQKRKNSDTKKNLRTLSELGRSRSSSIGALVANVWMDGCWLRLPPPPTTTTTPAQFLEPDFETGCRNFLKQKKEFGQPQPNFVHFHFSVSRFNDKFGRQIIKSDQTNQMEL